MLIGTTIQRTRKGNNRLFLEFYQSIHLRRFYFKISVIYFFIEIRTILEVETKLKLSIMQNKFDKKVLFEDNSAGTDD